MLSVLDNVLLGMVISVLLGIVAFNKQALSISGTLAAILVGAVIYSFGGPGWFGMLLIFFATSLFFTRYKAREKQTVVQEFAKGGIRDFWQVLANGGIAALLTLGFFYYDHLIFFFAFAGVIATVNADTWATEIGITSNRNPRLITNGKRVPVGTSGAVSSGGIISATLGALVIALTAVLFYYGPAWISPVNNLANPMIFILAITVAGLVGSLADSFLGATIQAMYYCDKCKKETERLTHYCGTKTRPIRGIAWFDNDLVNLASSMAGAILAAAIHIFLKV